MAKLIKKKKKFKISNLISTIFTISIFSFLLSSTLLKSNNVAMNRRLQNLKNENKESAIVLRELKISISQYTERDYLLSVCNANGVEMNFNSDRIIYIQGDE